MFRTDAQICRAVRVLLKPAGLQRLWTAEGPTDRACTLRDENGGVLSSGERILLLAAFAFWNGRGGCTLDDAIGTLDRAHVERLCSSSRRRASMQSAQGHLQKGKFPRRVTRSFGIGSPGFRPSFAAMIAASKPSHAGSEAQCAPGICTWRASSWAIQASTVSAPRVTAIQSEPAAAAAAPEGPR